MGDKRVAKKPGVPTGVTIEGSTRLSLICRSRPIGGDTLLPVRIDGAGILAQSPDWRETRPEGISEVPEELGFLILVYTPSFGRPVAPDAPDVAEIRVDERRRPCAAERFDDVG